MDEHDASRSVFDRLLDEAEPALLAGTHRRETPPVDGGRWPVSIVAVPDADTRELLAGLMADAERHAGPGHLRTGRTDASHLTLRALEPYRHAAAPDDAVADGWRAALAVVGRTCGPAAVRLTGVTLTTGGVLVQAEPVDGRAWDLMRVLGEALGPLGWLEAGGPGRDIWYASVLHLADDVRDPAGLVKWARHHRACLDHEVVVDRLTLTRYRHTTDAGTDAGRRGGEQHMALEAWHEVALEGPA